MDRKISIVLVGISGYGNIYLNELLSNDEKTYIQGVVDINPERSEHYKEVVAREIPIYHSLQGFYKHSKADLAIISTPIHLHKEQACYAMLHGSNVLCEKPISGNPADINEMIQIRNQTGKFLAIGFNWSFTDPVQLLKQDILSGLFGRVKRMKSLVLWPRNDDYYTRSSWAGKKYSTDGSTIFDSIANNATAHFLHHMFYLLGDTIDTSCKLKDVTAELYRANNIETFDTCAIRSHTMNNTELLFYASHAIKEEMNPHFVLEFELATITYSPGSKTNKIVVIFNDGSIKEYSDPEEDHLAKLRICVDAVIKGHNKILCGPEAATAHATCIQAMHDSVPDIPDFPVGIKSYEKNLNQWQVEGLGGILTNCYNEWILPSESNVNWSQKGRKIILA